MESSVFSSSLGSFCASHSPQQDCEVKNMIPAVKTNKEVAEYTMAALLSAVPIRFGLRSFAVRVALCLVVSVKYPTS